MTYNEFFEKYKVEFFVDGERPGRANYIKVLDDIYCTLTREQAIQLMKDYYDNADDIFNAVPNYIDEVTKI